MALSNTINELNLKINKTINRIVVDLYNELVKNTPRDTGQLATSWSFNKLGDGWIISNDKEYASIIFEGRRLVAGKMYGSEQLPAGIDPILLKYNIILTNELNKIRV